MGTKKVLILDGSIYRDIYQPADHWKAFLGDIPSDSFHLPSGEEVPDIAPYSHVIVTGSEASIMQNAPWFMVEMDAINKAFKLGKPILGSCFGHQMLVMALSGPEFVTPCDKPELGWKAVSITQEDELFSNIKNPFNVFVSHFDEVQNPPAPWKILASSDGCKTQAIRYGDHPIWGIQSHPEISPLNGRILIAGLTERLPSKADQLFEVLQHEPKDDETAQTIVDNFLAAG